MCVTGHQYVGCVQIMRWWSYNSRQWPLRNLGSVAYCNIFILVTPRPPLPLSDVVTPPPHNLDTPHVLVAGDTHYQLWYSFLYFGIFHSESITILVLCVVLAKKIHQFLLSVFLWMMLLILKINFVYNVSGYQTRIFHSTSVIVIVLCLFFLNSLFSTMFNW